MDTFRRWHGSVPEGFVFAVKASRYITHVRRLRDTAEPLALFLDRASLLGSKLGRAGKDCYVYFNNDRGGHAPRDARTLLDLLNPAR